jgi:hypothetical protein
MTTNESVATLRKPKPFGFRIVWRENPAGESCIAHSGKFTTDLALTQDMQVGNLLQIAASHSRRKTNGC